jgi:hypothetical protein
MVQLTAGSLLLVVFLIYDLQTGNCPLPTEKL